MNQSNGHRPRREYLPGQGTISGFALLDGLDDTGGSVETPTDGDSRSESLDAP